MSVEEYHHREPPPASDRVEGLRTTGQPPGSQRPIPPRRRVSGKSGLDAVSASLLIGIIVVGLVLRLREPLWSPIIGAEDPYLNMERAWNLLEGQGTGGYPPGFIALVAPFALLGPDVFYAVSRFLPPLIGAGAILTTFLLCRPYMHVGGALAAAAGVALMPEHIRRTNFLVPTALDMLVLPLLLLMVIRASEAKRGTLPVLFGLSILILVSHPLVFLFVGPAVFLFASYMALGLENGSFRRGAIAACAVSVGGLAIAFWAALPILGPSLGQAQLRAATLASSPGSILPLPAFVDPPAMLTNVAIVLALVGFAAAIAVGRNRFALLAILWCAGILPFMLADWFGIWYVPHRSVAYLSIGIAMLAGLGVSEIVRRVGAPGSGPAVLPTAAALMVIGAGMGPAAASVDPWYRLYDSNDYAAWGALGDRGTPYLVTGSWQARAGYVALTGREAVYNPEFFKSSAAREDNIARHPGLVVLVDNYTREAGLPLEFLSEWTLLGRWGRNEAYAPPAGRGSLG